MRGGIQGHGEHLAVWMVLEHQEVLDFVPGRRIKLRQFLRCAFYEFGSGTGVEDAL